MASMTPASTCTPHNAHSSRWLAASGGLCCSDTARARLGSSAHTDGKGEVSLKASDLSLLLRELFEKVLLCAQMRQKALYSPSLQVASPPAADTLNLRLLSLICTFTGHSVWACSVYTFSWNSFSTTIRNALLLR